MAETFYVDSWSPYVYGTPADRTFHVDQGDLIVPFLGMAAVVQKQGAETFWNGTAFVPYDQATLADIAFYGTMPHYRHWEIAIPWSQIGNGMYTVLSFRKPEYATDFIWGRPWATTGVTIRGARSDNPAGVVLGSSFGGVDALRVTDSAGHGIADVKVKATIVPPGNNVVFDRGEATTDSAGRWTLDRVCQPSAEHRIDFTKAGYTIPRQTITTGVAV